MSANDGIELKPRTIHCGATERSTKERLRRMKCLYSDCIHYEAFDDGDGFDPYCRAADVFLESPNRADEQDCVAGFDFEKGGAA